MKNIIVFRLPFKSFIINHSKTLCKLLAREIGRKADFFPGLGIKIVK